MVIQTKKYILYFAFSTSQASASHFEMQGFHMPSQQSFEKQILHLKLFQLLHFFNAGILTCQIFFHI